MFLSLKLDFWFSSINLIHFVVLSACLLGAVAELNHPERYRVLTLWEICGLTCKSGVIVHGRKYGHCHGKDRWAHIVLTDVFGWGHTHWLVGHDVASWRLGCITGTDDACQAVGPNFFLVGVTWLSTLNTHTLGMNNYPINSHWHRPPSKECSDPGIQGTIISVWCQLA